VTKNKKKERRIPVIPKSADKYVGRPNQTQNLNNSFKKTTCSEKPGRRAIDAIWPQLLGPDGALCRVLGPKNLHFKH